MSYTHHITNIKLVEAPAAAQMAARPLECRMDGRLNDMYNTMSNGGEWNSESILSPIANAMLDYTTTPERLVDLPGDHDESRFIINIEFLEASVGSTEKISYITGYTDHFDHSRQTHRAVSLPGDMRIYFNSTMVVSKVKDLRGRGGNRMNMNDSSQIITMPDIDLELSREKSTRRGRGRDNTPLLLTPSNITSRLSHRYISDVAGFNIDQADIHDSRERLASVGAYRSKLENNIPSNYLSKVMTGYDKGKRNRHSRPGDDTYGLYSDLTATVSDIPIQQSEFFRQLMAETNYAINGYITWKDLCAYWPEVEDDDVQDFHPLTNDEVSLMIPAGLTETWSSEHPETLIANHIVSSVIPLFSDLLLNEVDIKITNDTCDGKIDISVMGYHSLFDKLDLRDNIETLIYRIEYYILEGMWYTNTVFDIDAKLSNLRGSNLMISYDQGPDTPYNFASYASAIVTPLSTMDSQYLDGIAEGISELLDNIDMKFSKAEDEFLIDTTSTLTDVRDRRDSNRSSRGRSDRSPRRDNGDRGLIDTL